MSIEFVYFKKDENGLYSAGTEINSLIFRLFLDETNVENHQYLNNDLTNVYDMAEDILSEEPEKVCFIIDEYNLDYSVYVAGALKETDNSAEIMFVSTSDSVTSDDVTLIQPSEALNSLAEALGINSENYTPAGVRIYSRELLPAKYASEFGIPFGIYSSFYGIKVCADLESINAEIEFITKNTFDDSKIVLRTDDVNDQPHIDGFDAVLESNERLVVKENERKVGFEAITNGVKISKIGYIGNMFADEYTKHIEVEKSQINADLLESLSYHNSGNSAIYGVGSGKADLLAVKKAAKDGNFLLANYLDFSEEADGTTTVDINENKAAYSYKRQSYADYQNGEFTYIKTRRDFDEFVSDFEKFSKTGKIDNNRMWLPYLEERCRFAGKGFCTLNKLYKFKVDANKVYPCSGCSESIGNVSDQHFQLMRKAYAAKEKASVARNCDACEAKYYCSRCAMLNDDVSTNEYCDLMCRDYSLPKYMNTMFAAKYIFSVVSIRKFNNVSANDVTFVTNESNVTVSGNISGDVSYFDNNIVLFRYDTSDTYMSFNMTTRSAFEMNQNMFMLCELMYKGVSVDDIIKYLNDEFNVGQNEAAGLISDCLDILGKKGYLKKDFDKNGILQRNIQTA